MPALEARPSTGYSAWRGKRAGKRPSPFRLTAEVRRAAPCGEGAQRSTALAANSSRPLASPAPSSGLVEASAPRSPIQSANLPRAASRPLPSFKPANPPGPVSAAKALPKKLPAKRRREPGPLRALPCLSSRLTGQAGAEPSQGGQAEKQRGKQASARLGALGTASDVIPGLERLGVGRQETSGFRPVLLARPCSLFTCTLPWTRRPLEGTAEGGVNRRARGEACESCHAAGAMGRSACVCPPTPPGRRVTDGGKGRRTEGGLEARERCVTSGPLASGLRQSNEDGGPRAGRVAGEEPSLAAVGYITRSGVPWSALVRSLLPQQPLGCERSWVTVFAKVRDRS